MIDEHFTLSGDAPTVRRGQQLLRATPSLSESLSNWVGQHTGVIHITRHRPVKWSFQSIFHLAIEEPQQGLWLKESF